MVKLSIVMAYINRLELTKRTLDSIARSKSKDFEVVLVDDGSHESEAAKPLEKQYDFLRVIERPNTTRWSFNGCIPYNIGFANAKGSVVMIQNPECYHESDIVDVVLRDWQPGEYWVMGCYSLNQKQTERWRPPYPKKFSPVRSDGDSGWYNHSRFRPVGYHFASVIDALELRRLGGFHDVFFRAPGYDDNEFLHRVKQTSRVVFRDDLVVLHQWHYGPKPNAHPELLTTRESCEHNRSLFENVTAHLLSPYNLGWRHNIPQVAYFSPKATSDTIRSFSALNPSWRVVETKENGDRLMATLGGVWFDTDKTFEFPMWIVGFEGSMVSGDANKVDTVVGKDVKMASRNNDYFKRVCWGEERLEGNVAKIETLAVFGNLTFMENYVKCTSQWRGF